MSVHRRLLRACAPLLALIGAGAAAQSRVENVATLTYRSAGGERSVASNRVVIERERTRTALRLLLPAPGQPIAAASCTPGFAPAAVAEAALAGAVPARSFDRSMPLLIVLDDPAGNRDPQMRERRSVTLAGGGVELSIELTETAADSGRFASALPPGRDAARLSCTPAFARDAALTVTFAGDARSEGASAGILADPFGFVFDSRSGVPIDGAQVSLVELDGRPATVFGDDGTSVYPSTVVTGAAVTDASGRSYPGEAGRYRFPLSPPGRYRLLIRPPPGHSAPSQVSRDDLARVRAPDGTAYLVNDASFGAPLTIADVAPFQADIPVDRTGDAAAIVLEKTASVREAAPGDTVVYRITATNRGSASTAPLRLTDTLPPGLSYRRGSMRGAGEPTLPDGARVLVLTLPALAPGASAVVSYRARVAPGAPVGEAVNRVRGDGGGEAVAAVRIRPLLFTDALTVVGRVSVGACGAPPTARRGLGGIRLLLEDGSYVVTDRDGLYHFEGVRPGRHVVQLDTGSLPPGHRLVACERDTRQAGSARSRFVEGGGGSVQRVDFQLLSDPAAAASEASPPIDAAAEDARAAGNRDWLTGQQPGIDWLFPAPDHNPRSAALRVVVKHEPGQRVALTLNGVAPDPLAFDGTDRAGGVAVSTWTALPLRPGDNALTARVLNADGTLARTLERTVHLAGAPVRATFDPARSRPVADGLAAPLLAVRVTDAAGRPVRAGTIVPFRVDPPYTAAVDVELQQARQLAGVERAASTARVTGDDGYAIIALRPTTQAGTARVTIALAEDRQVRTSDFTAWLSAAPRDWVVVGFGAGTLGYDRLRRRSVALPAGGGGGLVRDGQLALYAKGRIRGSWLLTLAYDSDRRFDRDRPLLGTIDPDRYYTVYGDGTDQGYDAPTRRKLYLRLERRAFYALLGDFETGFTDTELGRYSRVLNGAQAAFAGARVAGSAFAAWTDQRYGRAEIQGNGLSGPYRLPARALVPGSEQVRIETRDRYRSERIVATRSLTRHVDYDIDSARGTLRFREPVLSRDAGLNPNFIVVDYETDGARGRQLVAGGRAAARFGAVRVGATALRDETAGRASVIAGDLRARLSSATKLRAEVAAGGPRGLGERGWLAEVEHHGARLDATVYARQQDADFGIGQQNLVEAGTRKFGADGRLAIGGGLSLAATGWHQRNLARPGTRTAGDVRLEYLRSAGTLHAGLRFAEDRGLDRPRNSRLATLGGTQAILGGAVTLGAESEFALGGADASVDFPARHALTASWQVRPGIRLIGGYEIARGEAFDASTLRAGFDVAPWTGAKLTSTLNQRAIGEAGPRTFAQYGLSQSLTLGERWSLDATLDAASTLRGRIPRAGVIAPLQPVASGGFLGQDQLDGDYAATTLGATYRQARWSWTGRVEYRTADAGTRWGITTSLLRTLGEGRTLAAGFSGYRAREAAGGLARSASADVALAWRPPDSRWTVLERLSVRIDGAPGGFDPLGGIGGIGGIGGTLGPQDASRIVNNLALGFRTAPEGAPHAWETTLYHGIKYVRGRTLGERYSGVIDVAGVELRRDLGTRFDIGVQGAIQHAWSQRAWAFAAGPAAGFTPASGLWLSVGYNVAGFRDRDFEADRYTRRGAYATLRFKFDQTALAGWRR